MAIIDIKGWRQGSKLWGRTGSKAPLLATGISNIILGMNLKTATKYSLAEMVYIIYVDDIQEALKQWNFIFCLTWNKSKTHHWF